jgi:hypothetical protein
MTSVTAQAADVLLAALVAAMILVAAISQQLIGCHSALQDKSLRFMLHSFYSKLMQQHL